MSIANNLQIVRQKIETAATQCGRPANAVVLVAVSKTHSPQMILEAYQEGQTVFGENYVQEATEKIKKLEAQKIVWHFIGQLQSNKVKQVVGNFALIHSVDRLSLAETISVKAVAMGIVQPVLLQIHLGDEQSKAGAALDQAIELSQQMMKLPGLRLDGLMSMPPIGLPAEQARAYFKQLQKKLAEIRSSCGEQELKKHPLKELSMGTSHDYQEAIAEGATLVRIGTDIFGSREKKERGN